MRKGFTLLELLAVIVILGIIISLAIPAVSSIIMQTKLSAYRADEKKLSDITKVYLVSNASLYSIGDGQTVRVTLEDLKNAGYISGIQDPSDRTNECDAYVEVRKTSSSYAYKTYLDCGDNYKTGGYDGLKLPIFTVMGSGSIDNFNGISKTTAGYVVVGYSNSANKDLDNLNKGTSDAIIVSYDNNGNVLWNKNYGGIRLDYFYDVTTVSDGYIAVGSSASTDNDLDGLNKGGTDAIIVKYDTNGNVVWKKNYGGSSSDYFKDIIAVSDGYIAIGYSSSSNTDLTGLNKGGTDGVVVKYDVNGNVVWKKNYGGTTTDYMYAISVATDGLIVAGSSRSSNGDLTGLNNGNYDAIIFKLDNSGNIVWKKNFGGTGDDYFYNIITISDGYIVTGNSNSTNGDLTGLNKGDCDGITVKYDLNGNVVWKKDYGGTGIDKFNGVSSSSDGTITVVGTSTSNNGDLTGLNRGEYDAIIVRYDANGNILWKSNYGGTSADYFMNLIDDVDEYIIVGYCASSNNDLTGLSKGNYDGSIVKYNTTNTIVWKKNFGGGPGDDSFENVAYFEDNYYAVGYSNSIDGELSGLNKGGTDAIIFKYNLTGQKVWQKNYGGSGNDYFYNIISTGGGLIAVGSSSSTNSDLTGLNKGGYDGIIVKYDTEGNVVWKKNFGGSGTKYFYGVVEVTDGYIAVGYGSSADGDLTGLNKGGNDAIIVKYDTEGNVVWKKDYGGTGIDYFRGVTFLNNNYIVIGYSDSTNGNLTALNKGGTDAIIVKYDADGNVVWNKNYGGTGADYFYEVIEVNNNYVAVGFSSSTNGDITGLNKGGTDATIVSFNQDGSVVWNKNFGGTGSDYFYRVVSKNNQLYVVGKSTSTTDNLLNKNLGSADAILAKYDAAGNLLFNTNFGGNTDDIFNDISLVRDGFIMVGNTSSTTNNFVDIGSSYMDAMVVGYIEG